MPKSNYENGPPGPSQEALVTAYFDSLAAAYDDRQADPFLHYFFIDRLAKATETGDFNDKVILDIGSGTGNLYDYIGQHDSPRVFLASDISDRMLQKSRVPQQHRFLGKIYEIDLQIESFDYIFMLGVSTYLSKSEMHRHIRFIEEYLSEDGVAIVSFTNRRSIDSSVRKLLKPFARILAGKERVLGQSFDLEAYTVDEVKAIVENETNLTVERIRYLNHTIFPFNRVFIKISLRLADYIEKSVMYPRAIEILSSDFLAFLRRTGSSHRL